MLQESNDYSLVSRFYYLLLRSSRWLPLDCISPGVIKSSVLYIAKVTHGASRQVREGAIGRREMRSVGGRGYWLSTKTHSLLLAGQELGSIYQPLLHLGWPQTNSGQWSEGLLRQQPAPSTLLFPL